MLINAKSDYKKCFACEQPIQKGEEIYEFVSSGETAKNKSYHRIHKHCLNTYELKKIEKDKWDNLYEYVRTEILQYDEKQSLNKHQRSRLQGMRSGEYGNKRNKKVSLSEEGYPYDVILMAFKVKKIAIKEAITERSKFKDEKHMFDYLMVIVESVINDVYARMKERQIANDKLDKLDYSKYQQEDYEYKEKANIKENKVAKLLNDLW